MLRRVALFVGFAFVAACGGRSTHGNALAPPASTTSAHAPLPTRDMRYVVAGAGAPVVVVVVHADGRVDRPGKQGAKIIGGRVVCDGGKELIRVDADDSVVFDDKIVGHLVGGAFAVDAQFGDWRAGVRDDGDVEMWTRSEGATSSHDLHWEGYAADARRTASLFTALFTPAFGGAWCGEGVATNPM